MRPRPILRSRPDVSASPAWAADGEGALYPPLAGLRAISRTIAIAVAREAQQAGLARMDPGMDAAEAVDSAIWIPEY